MIVLASSNLVLVMEVFVPSRGGQNQQDAILRHKRDSNLLKARGRFMFA
jgi:hypothetical protein